MRRILGKRGRTTIPYEFRQILDLRHNDVLTFAINDDKTCVVITKEKICTDCIKFVPYGKDISLDDFLSKMNKDEMLQTIAVLSKALVEKEESNATQNISNRS
jgi:bifunctional DNA-binding transcriptional regulator/antitoxin component of YhaV-PrlF toxin-antitoxin module